MYTKKLSPPLFSDRRCEKAFDGDIQLSHYADWASKVQGVPRNMTA